MKIGDIVFIPKLDKFGTVSKINEETGEPIEIIITNEDGKTTVNVTSVEYIVYRFLSWLVRFVENLFKKKI